MSTSNFFLYLNFIKSKLAVILIFYAPKFLSYNYAGTKILINLFIKLANLIIWNDDFLRSIDLNEMKKIFENPTVESLYNDINFHAIDLIKCCYELSINYKTLHNLNNNKETGDNINVIIDLVEKIMKNIALENEKFKKYENHVKKNIFSLVYLAIKNFDEKNLEVIIILFYS